jgi:WD repeat-containing protein 23
MSFEGGTLTLVFTSLSVLFMQLTGKRVAKLSFHRGTVRDVSWHPTEPMLVSSSWDGHIAKWEHLHGERPNTARVETRRAAIFTMDDYFDSD